MSEPADAVVRDRREDATARRDAAGTDPGAGAPPAIAHRATHSVAWLMAQSTASRVVQSLAQVVLAWLLSPAEFGTISIVFTLSSLANALFQFGLDDVLLRRRRTMRLWFRAVFWMSLFFGCCSALLQIVIALVSTRIYHEPRLPFLLAVTAAAAPLSALSVVPNTVLRARLRFRTVSLLTFFEASGSAVLSVSLAAAGAGIYSFVLPLPFMALCRTVLAWRAAGPAIGPRSRAIRWRKLLPSATAVLGSRILNQLVGQGDYIVFGLTATATQVGLYFFAFRIAGQPMRLLAGSLTGVLFPTLMQFKNDPARQHRAVMLASQIVALVITPLCFLQVAIAEPALSCFFDPRWAGATFFIQLLSVAFVFDAVSWTVSALLPAQGNFKTAFRYNAVMTCAFFAAISTGALTDASYGVPMGVFIYYIVAQPVFCFVVLSSSSKISLRAFADIYVGPVVISAAAVLCAAVSIRHVSTPMFRLILLPPISLSLYALAIWRVSPGPCRYFLARLSDLVGARRGRILRSLPMPFVRVREES